MRWTSIPAARRPCCGVSPTIRRSVPRRTRSTTSSPGRRRGSTTVRWWSASGPADCSPGWCWRKWAFGRSSSIAASPCASVPGTPGTCGASATLGGQAQVHERKLGRPGQLAQDFDGPLPAGRRHHREVARQQKAEGFGDQRIVVHQEQDGVGGVGCAHPGDMVLRIEECSLRRGLLRRRNAEGSVTRSVTMRPFAASNPRFAFVVYSNNNELLVQLKDVRFAYADREILRGINLRIPRGKVVAIMGGSGCGKTTLLRLIGGQLQAKGGEVTVAGESLNGISRSSLYALRRRMGMLFQFGALFTDMSVFDNVAFPLREHTDLPESMIRDLVLMKLGAVGLAGAYRLKPGELSGGMARRVALARAVALDPMLIMDDEPFAGLDPISLGVIGQLIRRLNDSL